VLLLPLPLLLLLKASLSVRDDSVRIGAADAAAAGW
jgi:hypothetical protein